MEVILLPFTELWKRTLFKKITWKLSSLSLFLDYTYWSFEEIDNLGISIIFSSNLEIKPTGNS